MGSLVACEVRCSHFDNRAAIDEPIGEVPRALKVVEPLDCEGLNLVVVGAVLAGEDGVPGPVALDALAAPGDGAEAIAGDALVAEDAVPPFLVRTRRTLWVHRSSGTAAGAAPPGVLRSFFATSFGSSSLMVLQKKWESPPRHACQVRRPQQFPSRTGSFALQQRAVVVDQMLATGYISACP